MSAPLLLGEAAPISARGRLDAAIRAFAIRWRSPVPHARLEGRAIGALLVVLGCIALADVVVAVNWDADVSRAVEGLSPAWLHFAEIVTRLGLSGYIFFLSALVGAIALLLRGCGAGRVADAALGLLAGRAFFVICDNAFSGLLGSQLIKHLVGRARPPLIEIAGPFYFMPFSFKSTFASFPSGHAVTAFATVSALALFIPRLRIPLYLLAIAVAISRVCLRAHYPSDVIAGAAIGLASTWLLGLIFARRRIVFVERGVWLHARGAAVIWRALRGLRLAAR